jgi:DNA-binding transcriptional MerR regulator
MTHLSVKTLRHYHDVGLLAPVEVDRETGYRYYARSQVATAQIIRRFRALDMPVEEVRSVLTSPDPAVRNRLIAAHLDRLERRLDQTRQAVTSLRALLDPQPPVIAIEHRAVAATAAAGVTESVRLRDVTAWMADAHDEVRQVLGSCGLRASGPPGGLWPTELFTDEEAEATVFLPVARPLDRAVGRVRPLVVPAAEVAVVVHKGTPADIDRTYAALGIHVSDREVGVEGPIREHYLVDRSVTDDASAWVTEIAWPIFRATP